MQEWAGDAATWIGVGASGGAGFFTMRWLLEWFSSRWDKRTGLIDVGTEKLIKHLEEQYERVLVRLSRVEDDLEECKRLHMEEKEEVSRLRGLFQGLGDARQVAALIVAQEKVGGK